jgi:hypothetical protein
VGIGFSIQVGEEGATPGEYHYAGSRPNDFQEIRIGSGFPLLPSDTIAGSENHSTLANGNNLGSGPCHGR